jgi:hypothetical protein
MLGGAISLLFGGLLFFGALPSTTTYQLNSYGFGSGGTANSTTGNYALEGISGEISSQTDSTNTYSLKPGFVETQQANVPTVTLSNPSNFYDKLHFAIGQQGNPSDALYALQVKVNDATCDFTTGTIKYVKSDLTLGASLTLTDYQDYATWGGGSGANTIGLSGNTNYCMRAKATQGKFTESAYGPSSSAVSTSAQQISFCLYTGANCAAGGNSVSFTGLVANTVSNGNNNIGVDLSTNANSGGSVYIYSSNGALTSTTAPGTPITSATDDLSTASSGFGARLASTSSLTAVSPYNQSGNNIGILATTVNTILNATSPVSSGTASIQLQAKASSTTKAATDYTSTLTVIAAAKF